MELVDASILMWSWWMHQYQCGVGGDTNINMELVEASIIMWVGGGVNINVELVEASISMWGWWRHL